MYGSGGKIRDLGWRHKFWNKIPYLSIFKSTYFKTS